MTEAPKTETLKLQASDADGVAVMSAILQDAILAVRDMRYDAAGRAFMLAFSRFRWEAATDAAFERVNCALTVQGVDQVQTTAFDQSRKDDLHELLALVLEGDTLRFVFAGGAQLRLQLAGWQLRLEDFGAPWPTEKCPSHEPKRSAS